MQHWREDCLQRLTRPGVTVNLAFAELAKICAHLGFDFCSFGVRLPTAEGAVRESWSTTYPDAWRERYLAQKYLTIDPVIARAMHSAAPVVWSEGLFADQRAFWEEARAHAVRHGWTLALNGRNGESGLLSLARSDGDIGHAELEVTEPRLLWLAHTVNGLAATLLAQKHPQLGAGELTPRESEVLRWTASGKTSAEIGRILGVSTRTVNFHIRAILFKLNAVNKTQAVVKAMMLDMLS